jgi:hypothetical protein
MPATFQRACGSGRLREEGNPEKAEGSMSRREDASLFASMSKYDGLQELYVDKLLAASDEADAICARSPSLQNLSVFGMAQRYSSPTI